MLNIRNNTGSGITIVQTVGNTDQTTELHDGGTHEANIKSGPIKVTGRGLVRIENETDEHVAVGAQLVDAGSAGDWTLGDEALSIVANAAEAEPKPADAPAEGEPATPPAPAPETEPAPAAEVEPEKQAA